MNLRFYLDRLGAQGLAHFTTHAAVEALGTSPNAVTASLRRVRTRGELATPYQGFHLIIPPEYRSLGCLPPDQFIPDLMRHLGLDYYAGLLTAAQYHGAAHQAPMVFQVMVAAGRPALACGGVRVQFVGKRDLATIPRVERNTLRGVLRISSREATLFDLVGYPGHAGGLSNVATLLSELAEDVDADAMGELAGRMPLAWVQRLGYLLDLVEASQLAEVLLPTARQARESVALRSHPSVVGTRRDPRWKVWVNEEVEADL